MTTLFSLSGIVGANGTGKSTLFEMIMGKEKPDSGEVGIPNAYSAQQEKLCLPICCLA